jgi:hypothetical protein
MNVRFRGEVPEGCAVFKATSLAKRSADHREFERLKLLTFSSG